MAEVEQYSMAISVSIPCKASMVQFGVNGVHSARLVVIPNKADLIV